MCGAKMSVLRSVTSNLDHALYRFRFPCPMRATLAWLCARLGTKRWSREKAFHTLRTFVSVHQGDYFRTLTEYRRLMMRQGFQMASAPDSAFGPIWCAWGYGRSMKLKQVYDTLPTVKKMGFCLGHLG